MGNLVGVPGIIPNNGTLSLQPGGGVPFGFTFGGTVNYEGHGHSVYYSNTTFTVPAGVSQVTVMAQGGGGGGGSAGGSVQNNGGGGGGGACVVATVAVTPNQQIAVTIGGAGTGAVTYGNGTNGGNTTFGSYVTAGGGWGGREGGYSPGIYGGAGGTGSSTGTYYTYSEAGLNQVGYGVCGPGANSFFGVGGAAGNPGYAASGYGAAGGGACAGGTGVNGYGGNGTAGMLIVFW
jgi:hypothetical protein